MLEVRRSDYFIFFVVLSGSLAILNLGVTSMKEIVHCLFSGAMFFLLIVLPSSYKFWKTIPHQYETTFIDLFHCLITVRFDKKAPYEL